MKKRLLVLCMSILLISSTFCLPTAQLSALAAGTVPDIGTYENVATETTITTNGAVTMFNTDSTVTLPNNGSAFFNNLDFSDLDQNGKTTFCYQADITFSSVTQDYGSLQLWLGSGSATHNGTAYNGYLVAAVRPVLGQTMIFLNNGTLGSTNSTLPKTSAADVANHTYTCTVKYDGAKVSVWIDGTLYINEFDLNAKDFSLSSFKIGMFASNAAGSFSNVKLWGDVAVNTPKFSEDDVNVAPLTNYSNSGSISAYADSTVINIAENGSGTFNNLTFADNNNDGKITYYYQGNMKVSSLTTASANNYGSLRFIIGNGSATYNNNNYSGNLVACVRPGMGQAMLFLGGGTLGSTNSAFSETRPISDITYDYLVKVDGYKVSLWIDGVQYIDSFDLEAKGLNTATFIPKIGFASEKAIGTLSDVKLWGDVSVDNPTFNAESDVNAADYAQMTIYDDSSHYTENSVIGFDYDVRGNFNNIVFDDKDNDGITYTYSADVTFNTAKSTTASIRLVYGKYTDTDGIEKYVETGIRPQLHQQLLFSDGNNDVTVKVGGITPTTKNYQYFNNMQTYRYTIKYDKGLLSCWINGILIMDAIDTGISGLIPEPGFHARNVSGSVSNIKIWGDVAAISNRYTDFVSDSDADGIAETLAICFTGDNTLSAKTLNDIIAANSVNAVDITTLKICGNITLENAAVNSIISQFTSVKEIIIGGGSSLLGATADTFAGCTALDTLTCLGDKAPYELLNLINVDRIFTETVNTELREWVQSNHGTYLFYTDTENIVSGDYNDDCIADIRDLVRLKRYEANIDIAVLMQAKDASLTEAVTLNAQDLGVLRTSLLTVQ